MILFEGNGTISINSFESVEEYRDWEARGGDTPIHIAYAMKMPKTAAGDALLNMCRIGVREEDGFEILMEKILGEAFQAGINLAQGK